MHCILVVLSISYSGIEILDDHPAEWISEGWEITEEVQIDPTDYFGSLTFPPEDLLQCGAAFATSDGSNLWRVVLLYDDELVALLEESSRPRRFHADGGSLSTSLECSYAVVSSRDSTSPWYVIDVLRDAISPFSVDRDYASDFTYVTEGYGGIVAYASDDGDVLGISSGISPTGTARLFLLSSGELNCVDSVAGSVNNGIDYSTGSGLFAFINASERGRNLIAFDWDLNELWSTGTGATTRSGCTQLSVAPNGSIAACELYSGMLQNDGFVVLDGCNGEVVAEFPNAGGITSVQVSPAGVFVGVTIEPTSEFYIDGDSTIIYIGPTDDSDSQHSDFNRGYERELAVFESRNPDSMTIRGCYSDGYLRPVLLGITDDGSVLLELTERLAVDHSDLPYMLKRLVILDREGALIWCSNPTSDTSGHFRQYGPVATIYALDPVISFAQTQDGYRVMCASEDGQAIRILTLSH